MSANDLTEKEALDTIRINQSMIRTDTSEPGALTGEKFETADIWLALALLSKSLVLLNVRKQGNKSFFVFNDTANRRLFELEFKNRLFPIEINFVRDNLRTLKVMVKNDPELAGAK